MVYFDPHTSRFRSRFYYRKCTSPIWGWFGASWCVVVQILVKECQANVEFKTLFPIMKKHLADGDDVPYFFRELMAMITTVTEDEW